MVDLSEGSVCDKAVLVWIHFFEVFGHHSYRFNVSDSKSCIVALVKDESDIPCCFSDRTVLFYDIKSVHGAVYNKRAGYRMFYYVHPVCTLKAELILSHRSCKNLLVNDVRIKVDLFPAVRAGKKALSHALWNNRRVRCVKNKDRRAY